MPRFRDDGADHQLDHAVQREVSAQRDEDDRDEDRRVERDQDVACCGDIRKGRKASETRPIAEAGHPCTKQAAAMTTAPTAR